MHKLVLLRHGQSAWNKENRFTGWVDVPLSPKGAAEARSAGEKLRGHRWGHDIQRRRPVPCDNNRRRLQPMARRLMGTRVGKTASGLER